MDQKDAWQEWLARNPFALGFYFHYKHGSYLVYSATVREDSGVVLVHYLSVLKHSRWTRTRANFEELVDGRPRFKFWRLATREQLAAAAFGTDDEVRRVFGSAVVRPE